ncbi:aminoglycoside phosphotransferase family protein [Chitinophaga sp. 22321]|uniref:Fructosamine kinase family protein n=1 Tax=Chitinophaga hostae TaxID=2831022 RepID=A0ABS5J9S2_9BACT|nr:aminoglycoside phosphotransferase family protein [Chitinophaga hostae]MBS0031866.1 fructosamine kinase family protein [Chitinophaga hostae]
MLQELETLQKTAEIQRQQYLDEWKLKPDGDSFFTHCSLLQPVLHEGTPAFLKIAMEEEERKGYVLMNWWGGKGAAGVLRYDEQALLLERISSTQPSLRDMIRAGQDDEATRIICSVAKQLHTPAAKPLPELIPLNIWFNDLFKAGDKYGPLIVTCEAMAKRLLAEQNDVSVLHGDLHHENIIHSDARGWVAIDPKRLIGERAFDFANILCNPNIDTALADGRLIKQAGIISAESGIPFKHLLEWIVAWAGLSATWILDDGDDASLDLGVAEIALGALSQLS